MEFPPVRKTIDGTTAYFYRDERMMVTVGDRVYGHPFYDSVGTDGEEIRTLLTEREHAALIFESTTLMFTFTNWYTKFNIYLFCPRTGLPRK